MAFPVYRGYSSQYGAGLGNVLGGLVRMAIPRLFKAAVPMLAPMVKRGAHSLVNHGIDALSNRFTDGTPQRKRPRPPPKRVARRKKPVKRNGPLRKKSLPGQKPRGQRRRDALS